MFKWTYKGSAGALTVSKVFITPTYSNLFNFGQKELDKTARIKLIDFLKISQFYFVLSWRICPFQNYWGFQKKWTDQYFWN